MRPVLAVTALAALSVGACFPATTPGVELWPTSEVPEIDLWEPDLQLSQNYDAFADRIRVEPGNVEGRFAVTIENLDQGRPVVVYYRDTAGDYQAVSIDAGGSIPVATTPQTILGVN